MTEIIFPENIVNIIFALNRAGYSAYAVGGCIRDSLLSRIPADWDVATSALPEQTLAVFGSNALPTGLKHGTVSVLTPGGHVEVTTFRTDGRYSDHRRPDSVHFVDDIRQDLSRRDFTINAMAAAPGCEIIDPFDGQGDLARKLLRCVGAPEQRFEEDALRMFRALRFSAKLDFAIETNTRDALYACAKLSRTLACERIETELARMLLCNCSEQLHLLFSSGLMSAFCDNRSFSINFAAVSAVRPERALRYAALCALLESAGACRTSDFLTQLRCDSATTRACSLGVRAAREDMPESATAWKMLLLELGEDACRCAVAAYLALSGQDCLPQLTDVLSGDECYRLQDLALCGDDLIALGYSGKALGQTLKRLLLHVIVHPDDNTRQKLLELL